MVTVTVEAVTMDSVKCVVSPITDVTVWYVHCRRLKGRNGSGFILFVKAFK